MDLNNIDDAEKFQRHFVTPLVEKVAESIQRELAPLVAQHADHEKRLKTLESNQRKALMGYAGIVAGITLAWHFIKTKYLSKFFS